MATNFEFYKDEILERTKSGLMFAKKDGNIVSCQVLDCSECDFGEKCILKMFDWLYAEHIEAPKLTKRERAFCEVVQTGWIARDENGGLNWSREALIKNGFKHWDIKSIENAYFVMNDFFEFVKWEDEKPWAVEDLLKLEVEE